MSFFNPEDVAKALNAVKAWIEKYPEASSALREIWKANYLTAGHKEMARLLIK